MKKVLVGVLGAVFLLGMSGVAQAATLHSTGSLDLTQAAPDFSSGATDASGHENLVFSFSYDAEDLDNGDSFKYGWKSGGVELDLAIVNGANEGGPAGDESGTVNLPLPVGAQVSDLEVYVRLTANAAGDNVNLSSIQLTGDEVVVIPPIVLPGAITNSEGESFTSIQDAVNGTDVGGTITVPAGTYLEHVVVDKSLTLQGANMGVVGNSTRGPESVVDGGNTSSPFQITANDVTIDGFTITNGSNGLGTGVHIAIGVSGGYELLNNVITGNSMGVYANCVDSCLIQNNLFEANNTPGAAGGAGIYLENSSGLTVNNNEFRNHTENNPVILAWVAAPSHTDFVFSNNSVHDNFSGPFILGVNHGSFVGNTISAPEATGISFGGGNSNINIAGNTITDSARGIRINDFSADFGVPMGPNSLFTLVGNTLSGNSEYDVGVLEGGYVGDEFDTPPTITLNGEAQVSVFRANGYVDEGAEATDVFGNSVEVTDDSESFNFNEVGTYTITYTATDMFGNTSTLLRTVVVRPSGGGGGGGGGRGNSAGAASPQASQAIANAGVILPPQAAAVINGEVLGAMTSAETEAKIASLKSELRDKISQLIVLLQAELNVAMAAQGL